MARIGKTLMRKPGWRSCPDCHTAVEFGYSCAKCKRRIDELIESAMTPALRSLLAGARERVNADLAADHVARSHARA